VWRHVSVIVKVDEYGFVRKKYVIDFRHAAFGDYRFHEERIEENGVCISLND
jgi:hypothetical protein